MLRREEARLAARADRTLLVSEAEAALFRARLPAATARGSRALGNGIDAALFDPGEPSRRIRRSTAAGPHLVFTGQMDYPPNIAAAALRAIERLMPAIRAVAPGRARSTSSAARRRRACARSTARRHARVGRGARRAAVPRRRRSRARPADDRARGAEQGARGDGDGAPGAADARGGDRDRRRIDGAHFAVADSDAALTAER